METTGKVYKLLRHDDFEGFEASNKEHAALSLVYSK